MPELMQNTSQPVTVLTLPGWQNSGPAHWQSRWEALHGDTRVQQHDWMHPLRGDWIIQLEEAVLRSTHPVALVAHSLGCIQVAAWASISQSTHRIKAALLVAPGDVEQPDVRPLLPTWQPVALQRLPFASLLVASHNDPFCTLARAQTFATAWGSELRDVGDCGHINADSGLGDWPEGRAWLEHLLAA
jgi:predicted alpha/beta hydrolase family esterase